MSETWESYVMSHGGAFCPFHPAAFTDGNIFCYTCGYQLVELVEVKWFEAWEKVGEVFLGTQA